MSNETAKVKLIMDLRARGIRSTSVLEAIETTPREKFVAEPFTDQAYADQSLPISCGQTISQPYIVAYMTEQLNLNDRSLVLEVGTGSGYQAAVLSKMCRRVFTLERYRTLSMKARQLFEELSLRNITTIIGDGFKGWPQQAPFDHIIVTASPRKVPTALVEQLAIGGIMIIPLNQGLSNQALFKVTKTETGFEQEKLIDVRFVPMLEGLAREKQNPTSG